MGLPVDILPNTSPFMDEDLSDNAFAYASVQVLKVGKREDGWHTDGGASLLHAGLTIFGSRQLLVKVKGEKDCISLAQRPGSFYVGNLCALEHNVAHGASAPGSLGDGPPENQVQITAILWSVSPVQLDMLSHPRQFRKLQATVRAPSLPHQK